MYYWRRPESDNVGDLLSEIVVNLVVQHNGVDPRKRVSQTKRLLAIGSVIDAARCDVTVWGSGLHHNGARVPNVKLDVRAVRGPKTRKLLEGANVICPQVYGDPAVLLPLFYEPKKVAQYQYTIIPHFSKEAGYRAYGSSLLTTLTSDWMSFIDRIASSKLVISGSLHGLIIAEAYGVPAVALSDIDTDWFKYDDYYLGTGRSMYPRASNVEEALLTMPAELPDFSQMQNALLESFPLDLWVC